MTTRWLFSGSSFGRVELCPPSAAMPAVDTVSEAASDGTDGHVFMGLVASGVEREQALELTPPSVRDWCAKINVEEIPRGEPEVSMAYDYVTGLARVTGTRHRRYAVRPTEIPMTSDLHVREPDERAVTVVDWKFTRWDHDAYYDRPQMELNTLAAASAYGAERAAYVVGVVSDEGAIWWEPRVALDAAALDVVAARVRKTVERIAHEVAERAAREARGAPYVPDVTRGHHCRYCPAFLACPATRAALAAVFADGVGGVAEAAGPAYTRVQAVEQWAAAARDIIKGVVQRGGPAPTGDGRVVALDSRGHFKLRRATG